jgi:Lectin C-type domain
MTFLSDSSWRARRWLSILLGSSCGCLSLEPLSGYSEGSPVTPAVAPAEPAPAPEPSPELEAEPVPEAELEAAEGLPADGEIALEPIVEEAPPSETGTEPACAAVGEFLNVEEATCYRRSDQSAAWVDALSSCQAWGGRLVTIDSRAEDDFLGAQMQATFWIGASDRVQEGLVVWSGGAPLAFSNWGVGQPDDFQGREDCIVKTLPAGSWNDLPCRVQNAYVCERNND